jgi:hypothetical protein
MLPLDDRTFVARVDSLNDNAFHCRRRRLGTVQRGTPHGGG